MEKIIICGFTGSGKTSLLAKLRKNDRNGEYCYFDLDQYIQTNEEGYNFVSEIIKDRGWQGFREIEFRYLKELLDSEASKRVISLGGGTLSEQVAMEMIKFQDCRLFWLDVDLATCLARIEKEKSEVIRPIVDLDSRRLKELYQERLSVFKKYCERVGPEHLENIIDVKGLLNIKT